MVLSPELNGQPLKLEYLGSNIASTESDVNIQMDKLWTVTDRLLTIWKSDLTDKTKQELFLAAIVPLLLYGCTDGNYTRMQCAIVQQFLEATPHKTAAV